MTFKHVAGSIAMATLLTAGTLSAQSGRGSLTGAVTDAAGGALQGAQITVDPGNASAVTDS